MDEKRKTIILELPRELFSSLGTNHKIGDMIDTMIAREIHVKGNNGSFEIHVKIT